MSVRIWLVTLGIVASVGVATVGVQASPESDFAAGMIAELKARHPGATFAPEPDPLSVTIKRRGKEDFTAYFHRIFGFCKQASKPDCAAARREFLDIILIDTPPVTGASLRLAVRDRAYIAGAKKVVGRAKSKQFIVEPIGDDLFATLVSDSEKTVAVVNVGHLAELKITREDAWRAAWAQTRAILPKLPTAKQLAKAPVMFQEFEFAASLLIDTDGWQQLAAKVGPQLFVTVAADNIVFVGKIPDGPGLTRLEQSVRDDCAAQPRCLSPNVYRFREGRWVIANQE